MSLTRTKKITFVVIILAVAAGLIGLAKIASSDSSKSSNKNKTSTLAAHVNASVKALDSANAINDPAWFTQAYAAGFRLYVLSTTLWDGTCDAWPQAQAQIADALAAGLKVGAYTRNPNCWQSGILATGVYQSKLQFFALDIETDPGVPATQAMVDGVKAMGIRPIIYTGSSMWNRIQGSTADDFSELPLWDADPSEFSYDSWQADYLSPTPVVYGGWNTAENMRSGVQQQLEYSLNGVNVDLDSFDATFLR